MTQLDDHQRAALAAVRPHLPAARSTVKAAVAALLAHHDDQVRDIIKRFVVIDPVADIASAARIHAYLGMALGMAATLLAGTAAPPCGHAGCTGTPMLVPQQGATEVQRLVGQLVTELANDQTAAATDVLLAHQAAHGFGHNPPTEFLVELTLVATSVLAHQVTVRHASRHG